MFNTAVTGAYAGLWVGIEAGYFQQEGIDLQLDHIDSTTRAVDAMLANQGDVATLDGQTVAQADVTGADLRLFGGVTNRLVYSMIAQPEIASGGDLKGKRIGINSPGSSSDAVSREALSLFGVAATDVAFVPLQTNPGILAGLIAKQVDAAALSPPTNTQARQAGLKELINLAIDGPPWAATVIGARQGYLASHRDLMLGFLRAYTRGIQRFKTDEVFGKSVLQKYLQIDDQAVIQDTWDQFSMYLADVPIVEPPGMQNAVDAVSGTNPALKDVDVSQFLDNSLVQQLRDQGFFTQLGIQQ